MKRQTSVRDSMLILRQYISITSRLSRARDKITCTCVRPRLIHTQGSIWHKLSSWLKVSNTITFCNPDNNPWRTSVDWVYGQNFLYDVEFSTPLKILGNLIQTDFTNCISTSDILNLGCNFRELISHWSNFTDRLIVHDTQFEWLIFTTSTYTNN